MKRPSLIGSAFLASLTDSSGCKEEPLESSSVKFTLKPEGASLIINGKRMGKTSITVPLDPEP